MDPGVPLHQPVTRIYTAGQESCPNDGRKLWIVQHRKRTIHLLDESIDARFRDKACPCADCSLSDLRFRPSEESMLALPGASFGLDVVMGIGSMRFRENLGFPRIHARLRERGVPISAMNVQYLFRNYLALISCQAGLKDAKLIQTLRQQGVMVPVIDGVQFGEGDPVLYIIIDALSRRPLFGREMVCRGADDLIPFIAQLKEIGVPILGVVSDKEKALVPAIAQALPGTPHQFCQLHYVENAAKPMEKDLRALCEEVGKTEEQLRAFERKLIRQEKKAQEKGEKIPEDLGVTLELCQAARAEARRTARAPFDPPPIKRHQGLEKVAQVTAEARRKKGGPGTTLKRSKKS